MNDGGFDGWCFDNRIHHRAMAADEVIERGGRAELDQ
jgi:hypothetical protein